VTSLQQRASRCRVTGLWLLCALCVMGFWLQPAWSVGAAAPFMPPARVSAIANANADASAADPAASSPGSSNLAQPVAGLAGIKLGAQPQALIDGQWFARGASVRGARLVMVSAGAVQRRHPDGRIERLLLTPQVEWLRMQDPSAAARSVAPNPARPTEMR